MSRLDDQRTALLAVSPEVPVDELTSALDRRGPEFATFVIDYGLGPLWHERTGRDEFHESRLTAEAHYMAQQQALEEIDQALNDADIEYAVIKGAANRLLLYSNPAIRFCHDLDILVKPADRVAAATALIETGFEAAPEAHNISRELVLSRGLVDIDLHWGLLREGRLRTDPTGDMIARRVRMQETWMLSPEDALYVLLVHPAFAKHLASWNTGLHRVADVDRWLRRQSCDGQALLTRLEQGGVRTAAWATLRWVQLLIGTQAPPGLEDMLDDLSPGRLRRRWLDAWLRNEWSERTSRVHWARLLGFSMLLHDTPRDAMRALAGRYRAHQRIKADFEVFESLLNQ